MLKILQGDCREVLKELPDGSVHMCCTSPPYWGLRDYGVDGQLGLESTPDAYVQTMVEVFREVRRVLRNDGTLWLNLGSSYFSGGRETQCASGKQAYLQNFAVRPGNVAGYKPKDMIPIPWLVAMALQKDGWYLRQWMPWVKRNAMPESTQDRPTTSCEVIFLLSRSVHYYYDAEAIKLPGSMALAKQVQEGYKGKATKDFAAAGAQNASAVKSRIIERKRRSDKQRGHSRRHNGFNDRWDQMDKLEQCSVWRSTRNSDWFFESIGGMLLDEVGDPLALVVNPNGFPGAHFATFPPTLINPMILAGCPIGGTVLDPFGGSGTTGMVALELGRNAILIELNPEYVKMAQDRCNITPGLPL